MAVDFPSDLILDVARAADPVKMRNVRARLAAGTASPGRAPSSETSEIAKAATIGRHLSRVAQPQDSKKVAKDFEALLVSNMVGDMMKGTDDDYFGGGFAGDMWKSMMADQIAQQVVKTADFGVASMVNKYFVRDGENIEPVQGVKDAQQTPAETRALDAARSGTQEMSREFIRKMMSLVGPTERG